MQGLTLLCLYVIDIYHASIIDELAVFIGNFLTEGDLPLDYLGKFLIGHAAALLCPPHHKHLHLSVGVAYADLISDFGFRLIGLGGCL